MYEPKHRVQHGGAAAFTLMEIIVVVVILAVAGLIAVPMMSSAADIQVRSAANRLAADLEYAKNMAITHQRAFTVVFDDSATATNGYSLLQRDASNALVAVPHPVNPNDFSVAFATVNGITRVRIPSNGVVLDPTSSDTAITFDYLGTPYTGLTADAAQTLNVGDIQLRDISGNFTLTVKVEPMTGYITIQ